MQLGFGKIETYLDYVTLVLCNVFTFSRDCRCLVTDEYLSRKWLI